MRGKLEDFVFKIYQLYSTHIRQSIFYNYITRHDLQSSVIIDTCDNPGGATVT